ncbi:hypothetical protein D3C80_1724820 [compost metagenome]
MTSDAATVPVEVEDEPPENQGFVPTDSGQFVPRRTVSDFQISVCIDQQAFILDCNSIWFGD